MVGMHFKGTDKLQTKILNFFDLVKFIYEFLMMTSENVFPLKSPEN